MPKETNDYKIVDIRKKMFENGKLIYKIPSVEKTKNRVKNELLTLDKNALLLNNLKKYNVQLSNKLQAIKNNL